MKHKALIRRLQISCLGLDRIDPLCLLVDDVVEALRENAMREVQRLGQEIEQEPVANVQFMRQVLSVAIAVLYEHYKDDVLRVFTLDDLQTVIDLSDSLRPQQVEDIYKRAWDILEVATLPQRTEQEPWCMKMNGCKTKCEDCPVEVVEPEQEPVCPDCKAKVLYECVACSSNNYPPQRTWVGLTEEEILAEIPITTHRPATSFARAIEAKLKEKNNAA
jgi:hypothetical protein